MHQSIEKCTGSRRERITFSNYPYKKDTRLAHVTLDSEGWEKAMKQGQLRVAWTIARVANNFPTMQCGNCKGWGHSLDSKK